MKSLETISILFPTFVATTGRNVSLLRLSRWVNLPALYVIHRCVKRILFLAFHHMQSNETHKDHSMILWSLLLNYQCNIYDLRSFEFSDVIFMYNTLIENRKIPGRQFLFDCHSTYFYAYTCNHFHFQIYQL